MKLPMRRQMKVGLLAATIAALAACETMEPSGQDVGMAGGAILGGVLGHQVGGGTGRTVATIGGAALGAFLGSRVGARMDRSDQVRTAEALETSRNLQATTWRNPDTGQHYTVMPIKTYEGASGPCREFTTVTEIDGHRELVRGVACRQSDGTWRAG